MAKTGRPTDYNPNLHPWLAEAWAATGLTEPEIAAKLGKADSTLRAWKKFPEFSAALKRGKEIPDDRVERSLYQRAIGYSHPSEKVFQFEGRVVRAKIVEHCPPDVTACIFWLKNRRRDQWRDKQDHELTGKNGAPLMPTQFIVAIPDEDEPPAVIQESGH